MRVRLSGWAVLVVAILATIIVYNAGLSGSYLFDDYPNIVDNHAVQPKDGSLANLIGAALSSSSSEFKRPLASLSFAANYLASGLDPFWMKVTNLAIHILNGLLAFLLARLYMRITSSPTPSCVVKADFTGGNAYTARTTIIAALIAGAWMLLPINLTAVLYVVQRMESMANLFVMLGLLGYVTGRRRMLETTEYTEADPSGGTWKTVLDRNFLLCVLSITLPTALGILAKETAVMLPLYALLSEWALFHFAFTPRAIGTYRRDPRIITLFLLVLALPMVVGLAWLMPGILNPATWTVRDFTLKTRLLSEARIVTDYLYWTLLPTPNALSFYHDNYAISKGLLAPWTTSTSIVFLSLMLVLTIRARARYPLVALGLALFFGCQLLTATVIPLELIYEHRNYFASFGLLLALVPILAAPSQMTGEQGSIQPAFPADNGDNVPGALPLALPRYVLLGGLIFFWAALTALTAYAWGNPLRLAEDLAKRAPDSPRAQYELGRTYIIYSHYNPASPFTGLAYGALETAAKLPASSILPEQALLFMNARMHRPLKDAWWDSLIAKLRARKATVQDESSLAALTQCVLDHSCDLPKSRMIQAFLAALSHPAPSARLVANYGNYAWNVLDDKVVGERMIKMAVTSEPNEPAYRITLIRMLAVQEQKSEALAEIRKLETLNYGGRLNNSIAQVRALPQLK